MSNLFKAGYVSFGQGEARIIDNNELANRKIEEYQEQEIKRQRAQMATEEGFEEEGAPEEFTPGIDMNQLTQLTEDQGMLGSFPDPQFDMEAMQADFNRTQEELLNLQSAQARGDAERLPADALTPDVFQMAVNTFIGTCCRLPQMGRTFSTMSTEDKENYDQSLRTLEKWAESARLALNSIAYEEAIIID